MKLFLWFLKAINSPWYMRFKAEAAMSKYGLRSRNGKVWTYVHEKKQIKTDVGLWLKNQDGDFVFYTRHAQVYGNYLKAYFPLKDGRSYSCEKVIELLKPKKTTTHE